MTGHGIVSSDSGTGNGLKNLKDLVRPPTKFNIQDDQTASPWYY